MAEYLVGQQQEQNIVAAVHTGDVVDSCGTLWQWENVSPPLLTIMEHIPLSILAGNHDLARERKGNKQYDLFAKREVIQRSWEGAEVYQRGEATCRLFTAGGTDFILVTLGFNNTPGARRWVKAALDENADRVALSVSTAHWKKTALSLPTATGLYGMWFPSAPMCGWWSAATTGAPYTGWTAMMMTGTENRIVPSLP